MATKKKTRRPAGCPPCPPCSTKAAPKRKRRAGPPSPAQKVAREKLATCSASCAGTSRGHGDCVKVCMAQKKRGSSALFGVKRTRKAK